MRINKSEKIRDFLKDHPEAKPSEVKETLSRQGVVVGTGLISNIKHQMKYKQPSNVSRPSHYTPPTPAKNPVTLDEMTAVVSFADKLGGIDRLNEVTEGLRQLQKS